MIADLKIQTISPDVCRRTSLCDGTLPGIFGIIISLTTPCGSIYATEPQDSPQKPPARFVERFQEIDWLIGEWQGYGVFTDNTTYIHRAYKYDVAGMSLKEIFELAMQGQEYETMEELVLRRIK